MIKLHVAIKGLQNVRSQTTLVTFLASATS